jgi:hypothetical protein
MKRSSSSKGVSSLGCSYENILKMVISRKPCPGLPLE